MILISLSPFLTRLVSVITDRGQVERLYRDVRAYAIPGGSEEIMLDLSIRQALRVHKALGMKL